MSTPKFDKCCIDLLKRIPDQFRASFTAGGGILPDGHFNKASAIIDYVNRGMQDLFNNYWQATNGDIKKFISIFPELITLSGEITLVNGNYTIASPYKDFYKLVGALKTSNNKFIKIKDESLYTVYLTNEYPELTPTESNPVIIQINQLLSVFPLSLSGTIKIQYVRVPIDPDSGGSLIQNGSKDSPFFEHWNKQIVDNAYLRYLQETNQTT